MVTLNTPDQKRLRFMLDEANVLSNIRLEFDAALYHLSSTKSVSLMGVTLSAAVEEQLVSASLPKRKPSTTEIKGHSRAELDNTVRFKSQGRVRGAMNVETFRGGGWKAWLEFQLEIRRIYIFMGLDDSGPSVRDLHAIVSQLLTERISSTVVQTFRVCRTEEEGEDNPIYFVATYP
ncbi:hypothetical protein PC112_g5170 [Phytophthora cactorum]|nr:hypothetical protein PC112_g5170 [Phytophthora cactorum]